MNEVFESDEADKPIGKRRRPNSENDSNDVASGSGAAIAAVPPHQEQSPDICKLDIDCFDETCEYLPIRDLIAVGQTCKRLSQMAGYTFHQNYPAAKVNCQSDAATYFPQFIRKVNIQSQADFQHFVGVQSKFRRLEQIQLSEVEMTDASVESIKGILGKVNFLRLIRCTIDSKTFENLIDLCPNIQHLCVDYTNVNGNSWLLRKFSTLLEHLEFLDWDVYDGVMAFLELNPNIRKFAIDPKGLMSNIQSMKNANIKLDDLMIEMDDADYFESPLLFDLLRELYKNGFYKRLHLYFYEPYLEQDIVDQLMSLNGLVKIKLSYDRYYIALSALSGLEELSLISPYMVIDFEDLPTCLPNLKHVHLVTASSKDLAILISQAARLEKIKIDDFYVDETDSNGENQAEPNPVDVPNNAKKIVNLSALNKKRMELANGRDLKVSIYIEEQAYLATKWKIKVTECGLIRLKRLESYEWDNNFILFL